ncbi:MAG: methyltransferase domain-containing protein [Chitinophagaceae bacterium]
MKEKILFVSHPQKKCGVHEFGVSTANVLKSSALYDFIYAECGSMDALYAAIKEYKPVLIIYNYHISTLPWLTEKIIHTKYRSLNRKIGIPQVGIMHEVTQQRADTANDQLFDYHIAPDPTLLLQNPLVFKTGRLVPAYENHFVWPAVPTIGSFGFATPNKGFEEIIKAVQQEFDSAVIRFNIPAADFADKDGSSAHKLVEDCKKLITKPGISLVATHDFLDNSGVLDFLAGNTLNIFLYQDTSNRGISSTADYALAVDRPLAISDSIMFRHLHGLQPSIIYGKSTLQQIVENGTRHLHKLTKEWNAPNLVWDYERIVTAVLKKETEKKIGAANTSTLKKITKKVRQLLGAGNKSNPWLRNTNAATEDVLSIASGQSYTPVVIPPGDSLNRILDNDARLLYKPAVDKLTELVPLTMAKKIPEANVQQAFVFDTVFRMLQGYENPRMLCVGSYEDTAAMGLKRMGFAAEEIDPVLNYYLQEFYNKPSVKKNSYDIIFSTSVIEHDPDDESFIKCIEGLLAPGGKAVITCDFKDGWKPGDPKPEVDARFYTKHDLSTRLLSYIPQCRLVDKPQWDCENPDFHYLGKYQYTFATFVIEKNK